MSEIRDYCYANPAAKPWLEYLQEGQTALRGQEVRVSAYLYVLTFVNMYIYPIVSMSVIGQLTKSNIRMIGLLVYDWTISVMVPGQMKYCYKITNIFINY